MIVTFSQVRPGDLARVGGKGMNLGALAQAGFPVPPGFCVTTRAYRETTAGVHELPALLRRLSSIDASDAAGASEIAATIRALVEDAPVPSEIEEAIRKAVKRLGASEPCAVRSSATAEDLPTASFAGQQDTYLNVSEPESLLLSVKKCWSSL